MMKCGVITPIGPGHAELFAQSCRPSVERALAYSRGPFDEITLFAMDDTEGRHGRSNRRNAAIRQAADAGIDWLFLLDADDVLAPNAFEAFGRALTAEPGLDVLWGLICEIDAEGEPHLREDQPERIDSYAGFLSHPPAQAVQIGGFYRTELLVRFGFDEAMDTGEDYRLYLQLWQAARCAKRPEILFLNRRGQHSTGPRAATGRDWRLATDRLWAEAVRENPLWADVAQDGVTATLRITNPNDLIQRTHLGGHFFEEEPLTRLHGLVPRGARIVDVGANIGNHVVWYAQHLAPEAIFPVEPNPAAIHLLDQNIAANGIEILIDRRGIGLGVGRAEGRFRAETDDADNLGATSLRADSEGDLRVVTLDALLGDTRVDFIKIDAEGMELDVLAGAARIIARDRPVLWIEVQRSNLLAFAQRWCRANGYRLADSVVYVNTMDYYAVPEEFVAARPQTRSDGCQKVIEEVGP